MEKEKKEKKKIEIGDYVEFTQKRFTKENKMSKTRKKLKGCIVKVIDISEKNNPILDLKIINDRYKARYPCTRSNLRKIKVINHSLVRKYNEFKLEMRNWKGTINFIKKIMTKK